MSDININGIPNMGFAGAGGGYFGGNAALGIPAMGAAGDFGASKFSQPLYNSLYGAQGFGGLTDYYSGLGAAYGRATGGFGTPGSNPGWQDPNVAPSGYDPFSAGGGGGYGFDNSAYLNAVKSMMGGWGGSTMGSAFDQGAGSLGSMSPFGGYQPAVQPGAMDFSQLWGGRITPQPPAQNPWNSYFNDVTAPATAAPASNAGFDPFSPGYGGFGAGGGWGQAPQLPNIQALLGYNPATSAQFAPQPSQNASPFFGAFANFPNSATPSQYTHQPYTNVQGQTFQPNLPQGFAPLYGVDNPQGALPLNWNSSFGPSNSAQPGG